MFHLILNNGGDNDLEEFRFSAYVPFLSLCYNLAFIRYSPHSMWCIVQIYAGIYGSCTLMGGFETIFRQRNVYLKVWEIFFFFQTTLCYFRNYNIFTSFPDYSQFIINLSSTLSNTVPEVCLEPLIFKIWYFKIVYFTNNNTKKSILNEYSI